MCGRYASARSVDDIAAAFGIAEHDVESAAAPDWNVAPTKPATVVVVRDGHRVLTTMRWGLVPSWARDPSGAARMINARIESVADKPAFRDALAARRCLLPADGWYEWTTLPDGTRQPYYLEAPDAGLLAFAGLWETWIDAAGRPLVTTTVLTGPAPDDLRFVHDRAPVVLEPSRWATWLDPGTPRPADVLTPTPTGVVVPRPVGTAVGDVRSNGPALTAPIELPDQQTLF